jgi:hypothetical protein
MAATSSGSTWCARWVHAGVGRSGWCYKHAMVLPTAQPAQDLACASGCQRVHHAHTATVPAWAVLILMCVVVIVRQDTTWHVAKRAAAVPFNTGDVPSSRPECHHGQQPESGPQQQHAAVRLPRPLHLLHRRPDGRLQGAQPLRVLQLVQLPGRYPDVALRPGSIRLGGMQGWPWLVVTPNHTVVSSWPTRPQP